LPGTSEPRLPLLGNRT